MVERSRRRRKCCHLNNAVKVLAGIGPCLLPVVLLNNYLMKQELGDLKEQLKSSNILPAAALQVSPGVSRGNDLNRQLALVKMLPYDQVVAGTGCAVVDLTSNITLVLNMRPCGGRRCPPCFAFNNSYKVDAAMLTLKDCSRMVYDKYQGRAGVGDVMEEIRFINLNHDQNILVSDGREIESVGRASMAMAVCGGPGGDSLHWVRGVGTQDMTNVQRHDAAAVITTFTTTTTTTGWPHPRTAPNLTQSNTGSYLQMDWDLPFSIPAVTHTSASVRQACGGWRLISSTTNRRVSQGQSGNAYGGTVTSINIQALPPGAYQGIVEMTNNYGANWGSTSPASDPYLYDPNGNLTFSVSHRGDLNCTDGFIYVHEATECRRAATEFGSTCTFQGNLKNSQYPVGCFQYFSNIYYNTAASGAAHVDAARVCRRKPDQPAASGTCESPDPMMGTKSVAYLCPTKSGFFPKENPTGTCDSDQNCLDNCCQECFNTVELSGGECCQYSRMGNYTKTAIPGQQGRPIFKNANDQYVYYWEHSGCWVVGSSYMSNTVGVESKDEEFRYCPYHASGFKYWNGTVWATGLQVQGHPT